MSNGDLNWITNYIWGIADDVLRDLYVRGKYRDVILPMTVLHRLDAVLEEGKQAVLQMKASLDDAGVVKQDAALRRAAGQSFYNVSPFTLRDLRARASRQQLEADFRAWLDGACARRPQHPPPATPAACNARINAAKDHNAYRHTCGSASVAFGCSQNGQRP